MTVIQGIPVTALPRTALDLAAVLSPAGFEHVLERSEERGSFDLPSIEDVLARNVGHPGAGNLRRAVEIYRPEGVVTRSGLERDFRALVRRAGLPPPAMNYSVAGFELDAYWERERFAVELDVFETHGSHAAFERDRLREDDLLLIGVETIRVTGSRLAQEPTATINRVAAHLAAAAANSPELPGPSAQRAYALCRPVGDKVHELLGGPAPNEERRA